MTPTTDTPTSTVTPATDASGAAVDQLRQGVGPLVAKAKDFAKAKPAATAALVGVLGIALLNTLRGRR